VNILSNFKELREEEVTKSRSEYLEELKNDLTTAYDYSQEVLEILFELFPPNETVEFIEANENQRPLVIRTNTLKTKRKDLAKTLI
jgi:ribosomal RNA methyltransferase Nop2